jgi:GH18 family chitinase
LSELRKQLDIEDKVAKTLFINYSTGANQKIHIDHTDLKRHISIWTFIMMCYDFLQRPFHQTGHHGNLYPDVKICG